MAPPPPALPVPRLIDDDPVDPGSQGGLAAEAGERPEDAEEDLLRQVEGFVAVPEQVERQGEDHALVGIAPGRRRRPRRRCYTAR